MKTTHIYTSTPQLLSSRFFSIPLHSPRVMEYRVLRSHRGGEIHFRLAFARAIQHRAPYAYIDNVPSPRTSRGSTGCRYILWLVYIYMYIYILHTAALNVARIQSVICIISDWYFLDAGIIHSNRRLLHS